MDGGGSIEELERNLAEVARALFGTGSVEGSLQLTVELAVATVEGCDAAGIFVVRDGRVVTAAASNPSSSSSTSSSSPTTKAPASTPWPAEVAAALVGPPEQRTQPVCSSS